MKKIRLLLFPILFFASCIQHSNSDSSNGNTSSGVPEKNYFPDEDEVYSVFYTKNLIPELRNVRPQKSDTSIQICIPAAFTLLENDSIDGLCIIDGKIISQKINHHLGGGMSISKNKIHIIHTDDGKILTDSYVNGISQLGQSFFQQIQLVRNDSALEFHKDQKLFQRRAVVIFDNPDVAIVESKNAITLQEFADDLVKMHVKDAIYTDMGSYDEGWYRNPENKRVITMGKNCSQTSQQSNWLIFRH